MIRIPKVNGAAGTSSCKRRHFITSLKVALSRDNRGAWIPRLPDSLADSPRLGKDKAVSNEHNPKGPLTQEKSGVKGLETRYVHHRTTGGTANFAGPYLHSFRGSIRSLSRERSTRRCKHNLDRLGLRNRVYRGRH